MKKLKSHFKFNKQERNGIFYLLVIIVILQVTFFLVNRVSFTETSSFIENKYLQSKLDSLKNAKNEKAQQVFFPFNPNYITDYKGYTLGMSNKEVDRLLKYRSSGKYVNSTEQFQLVTGVSDSLLNIISPYFKYPDWVGKEKEKETKKVGELSQSNRIQKVILDINAATAEDFKTINGIGEKLSARIVKFRDRLGGFLTSEQLYDVYGLDVEVANRAIEVFQVVEPPQVKKININTAEPDELARLLYINFNLASNIVAYRQQVGAIKSFEELNNIEDFPKDKIDRIALYLSL